MPMDICDQVYHDDEESCCNCASILLFVIDCSYIHISTSTSILSDLALALYTFTMLIVMGVMLAVVALAPIDILALTKHSLR